MGHQEQLGAIEAPPALYKVREPRLLPRRFVPPAFTRSTPEPEQLPSGSVLREPAP